MSDKNIGSLPAAASIEDDSLLVAEQQGEAVHFTGKQLKDYAKSGVDALVAAAEAAADRAETSAGSVEDVAADAQAAKAAAAAAAASQAAAARSEQGAAAAQNAASGSASAAKAQADRATSAAQTAATTAAQQAAGQAASQVSSQLRAEVQNLVNEAGRSATIAQSAAKTAAEDAVEAAESDIAGYVSAAQTAKDAAEKARDDAQAAVGGNFMDKSIYDPQGKETDIFAYVDEKLKDVDVDITADKVTFADGDTFQQKYDSGELNGPIGPQGNSIVNIKKDPTDLSGSTLVIQVKDYATNTIATYTFTLPEGPDGPIYYPSIDADGNLEWALIGGGVYPTPDPVNIKGKDATINSVNALTVQGGDGIEAAMSGSTLTIKAKNVETWTFTLEDDSIVTKKVVLV